MRSPGRLSRLRRSAQRLLDGAAGATLAAILVIVLWGVFARFVLDDPSAWTEEAARLLLVWLTMLGAAAAAGHSEHLGIDFVPKRLHPDAQRALRLAVEVSVIAFALAVLVLGGGTLVVETLRARQVTPALKLPMGCVYLAAPLGGLGIALFSSLRLLAEVRGESPPDPHTTE